MAGVTPPPPGWGPSSPPPPPPSSQPPPEAYQQTPPRQAAGFQSYTHTPQMANDASIGDPPVASTFSLDDIHVKTLQTIFTLLDSDQDTLLDVDQLRTAIIAMGIPPSQRLIQEILKQTPSWAGQAVDFNTFRTVITERLQSNPVHMADIDELFKVFADTDGNGFITDHHLRHVMEVKTTNNTNLSDEEVDEIFKELHIKKRQNVDYRQFLSDISSGFVNFE